MRVGLVTDFYYPWIAGPSGLIRNLGHGLATRGHSVSLLAPSPTGRPYAELDGPIRITRARSVPAPFGFDLRTCLPLGHVVSRWLDDSRPDVVHIHHPFPLSATALFAARRAGIPVAATNHTIPDCSLWGIRTMPVAYPSARWGLSAWIRTVLNHSDRVATPTRTAAKALVRLGFHGPISCISNGVDLERFSPGAPDSDLRRRLDLDDRPAVLYTGRLDAEKQMDVWLEAAQQVLQTRSALFLVGGQGTERASLQQWVRDHDLARDIRFLGYLSDGDFPQLYRLAAVYCITSPVELQSITTLEAIASGLPVVGVDAQALPELVRDGRNGYCLPAGDSAGIATALGRLLADAELRRRMGAESRALAIDHDLRKSIIAYERFLAETAGDRREDGRP